MKSYVLLTLFTLCSFAGIHASNDEVETTGSKIVDHGNKGLDRLQKLTEVEPMLSAINKCKADPTYDATASDARDKLIQCAWDRDVSKDDTKRKQVFAMLKSKETDPKDANSTPNEFSPDLANFKVTKSSATKVLEKYLMKKLEEALYGDNPGKNTLKVAKDHTDFYRLYQSKLGQTLISELSAFCIYSNPTAPPQNVSDAEKQLGAIPFGDTTALTNNKRDNLANLKKVSGKESAAFAGYSNCIGRISQWCEQGKTFDPNFTDQVAPPCELNRLMTSVKIALKQTESLVKTFDNREATHHEGFDNSGFNATGQAVAKVNNNTVDINKVTNMGSKEFIKDSGYEAEKAKEAKEIEANCLGPNPEKNPICQKYLTKESDNKKILLEFELRNKVLAAKVEQKLSNPTDANLKAVLKEQGLTDEEYAKLKEKVKKQLATRNSNLGGCQTVEECIKDQITNRMNHERDQLVASLQKKLKQTQYDDKNTTTSTADTTLRALANNYKQSPKDLAHVYQYSNIVSSFIKIGDQSSNERNTAALSAELGSNYFDPNSSGRQTASTGNGTPPPAPVDLSALKSLDNSGSSSNNPKGVNLGSGQINEIQGWVPPPPKKAKSN